mmetsp:Transcript_28894/g.74149  ORF Transcript_28894/g.74149 Transcript_28894/m.74149 type:complete len:154 (-) Transcript_28894:212-673(-)
MAELQVAAMPIFDKNRFVDDILNVVFEHCKERRLLFSSFEPDICTLLSLKQPRFPVFFLTVGGTKHMMDARARSLRAAVHFARSIDIIGIVSRALPLLESPQLISAVKEKGLLLATYGDENNQTAAVDVQVINGVDTIVADHVAHVSRHLQCK